MQKEKKIKFFKKYSNILSVIMEVLQESLAPKQITHLRSLFKIESGP